MRNAEIRGLTWDCIRWEDGEVLVCKSLRRDGYSSGHHSWASTKTGRERVVPLTAQVLERCGLKPRRLYAQRHSFLSHALAMGNSPADLAAAAGHSTKMLLETYAKFAGSLKQKKQKRCYESIYKSGCISA